ncbi:hypothetical protein [Leucobacter luti]|uniref:hypothetical protein n=1 Tax=Leucobacter luti TaxID=340320 RepID=UPI001C6919E0|nr:hypothetical protein [Leucobacter luti]QYM75097.1 hypothetical protein K1X41_10515 [Leucobacter luti]
MGEAAAEQGAAKHSRMARSGTGALLLAAAVLGAVVSWWICVVQRVPVSAASELAAVQFGAPIPWIAQDLTASPQAAYPSDVRMLLTGNSAWDAPAEYDWGAFAANTLMWGAAVWAVGALLIWLATRVRRSGPRPESQSLRES